MEKNFTGQSLSLAILVLLFLTGLSILPSGTLGDFDYRKMDIFSDIRDSLAISPLEPVKDTMVVDSILFAIPDSLVWSAADSTSLPDSLRIVAQKDSIYFGRIIEDYTYDQQGLNAFFLAIDSIRMGGSVRIAWYGDSFVEGDILVGDLRDTLQSVWGGSGVGFVPITSEVAQFKRTIKHNFKGWTSYSIVKK